MLDGVDPADAGGGALSDVAKQTGPSHLAVALENACAACAGWKHAQEEVDGLADCPGVGVGAEVAHALALGTAHHRDPRELLVERNREVGVALVVSIADVEARVVLLDPGVFELQGLDLGVDRDPVDAARGRDHCLGARMQRGEVLEVGRQPAAQALGLADVDDPTRAVAEPVDAGRVGHLPRCGSIRCGIGHRGLVSASQDSVIVVPRMVMATGASADGGGPSWTEPSTAENTPL